MILTGGKKNSLFFCRTSCNLRRLQALLAKSSPKQEVKENKAGRFDDDTKRLMFPQVCAYVHVNNNKWVAAPCVLQVLGQSKAGGSRFHSPHPPKDSYGEATELEKFRFQVPQMTNSPTTYKLKNVSFNSIEFMHRSCYPTTHFEVEKSWKITIPPGHTS